MTSNARCHLPQDAIYRRVPFNAGCHLTSFQVPAHGLRPTAWCPHHSFSHKLRRALGAWLPQNSRCPERSSFTTPRHRPWHGGQGRSLVPPYTRGTSLALCVNGRGVGQCLASESGSGSARGTLNIFFFLSQHAWLVITARPFLLHAWLSHRVGPGKIVPATSATKLSPLVYCVGRHPMTWREALGGVGPGRYCLSSHPPPPHFKPSFIELDGIP